MEDLKEPLAAFYRQYRNEFLTIERFADYHGITLAEASTLLQLGARFHEEIVVKLVAAQKKG